jgi:hypothetical protein
MFMSKPVRSSGTLVVDGYSAYVCARETNLLQPFVWLPHMESALVAYFADKRQGDIVCMDSKYYMASFPEKDARTTQERTREEAVVMQGISVYIFIHAYMHA